METITEGSIYVQVDGEAIETELNPLAAWDKIFLEKINEIWHNL